MTDPAAAATNLAELEAAVVSCDRCPRLVEWREEVGRVKRAAYSDRTYWARPVPGFGDPRAWLLIVGLAPGAHGANRTGRMFTGDRAGDWLFGALHRAGLANQPTSAARDDGLILQGAFVTAAVRCVPPANKPTAQEWRQCRPFLRRELELLTSVRVIVALGGFAYTRVLQVLTELGATVPRPRPKFSHGVEVPLGNDLVLLGSYHPSQQNTFTGRLTRPMFDAIWQRAVELGRDSGDEIQPASGRQTPRADAREQRPR